MLKRVVANRTQTALLVHPDLHPELHCGERTRTEREGAPECSPRPHPERCSKRTRAAPVTATDAESEFMSELASGAVPSLRSIRSRLHVGQDRAKQIRDHLETVGIRT